MSREALRFRPFPGLLAAPTLVAAAAGGAPLEPFAVLSQWLDEPSRGKQVGF
jgi:hypothetical protein